MTQFVTLEHGRIACDVAGTGPLVVLSHGMGTRREDYRHLAPRLARAGYRVVNADMRGHGESSLNWPSVTGKAAITQTDVARDLLGVIRHFGGPAVIVGHSLSGGAATIAAAKAPDLVAAVVEINPFTRIQRLHAGALLTVRRYRRGLLGLAAVQVFRSLFWWRRYLNVAYPTKPDDYEWYLNRLSAKLKEPGRWAEFMKTSAAKPAESAPRLSEVRCPALVIMGAREPDFADPRAEGAAIVAAMPTRLGSVAIVENAGHYPHSQVGHQVADLLIPFLDRHTGRDETTPNGERQRVR